jgi:hypothetical protein
VLSQACDISQSVVPACVEVPDSDVIFDIIQICQVAALDFQTLQKSAILNPFERGDAAVVADIDFYQIDKL